MEITFNTPYMELLFLGAFAVGILYLVVKIGSPVATYVYDYLWRYFYPIELESDEDFIERVRKLSNQYDTYCVGKIEGGRYRTGKEKLNYETYAHGGDWWEFDSPHKALDRLETFLEQNKS